MHFILLTVKEGQYFIAEQNRRSERLEIEGCRDGGFLFNLSGKSIFVAISFAAQCIVLKKEKLHLRTSNSLSRTMHSEDTKENVLQKPSTTGARKKWFLGHFDEITEFNTSSSTPVQATYNF